METIFDWTAPIITAVSQMIQGVVSYLPQLLGALLLLVVGWLAAKLLRALVLKLSAGIDRTLNATRLARPFGAPGVRAAATRVLGGLVYWTVILFFVASATSALGLTMFTGWLDKLVAYLPNILSGILIILAGIVVANIIRDTVATLARTMPERQRTMLARAAQILALSILVVVGVDQIGIDITVVITVLAIFLGTMLGGLSIAFSLGARTLVSNLIGARYLSKDYRVGERVRIGRIEGIILDLTPVAVVLETTDGRMTVPAKMFSEEMSLLVHAERQNG